MTLTKPVIIIVTFSFFFYVKGIGFAVDTVSWLLLKTLCERNLLFVA